MQAFAQVWFCVRPWAAVMAERMDKRRSMEVLVKCMIGSMRSIETEDKVR